MKVDGKEIPASLTCWCGCTADFHHIASTRRNDGKRTIWYKCLGGHRNYHEIQEGRESREKKKEPKKKPKPLSVHATTTSNKTE